MAIAQRVPINSYHFKGLACYLFCLFFSSPGICQKYNFSHYDAQSGLTQSQILKIYQDQNHYMWFGSYGGASRFDGKEFRSYTKADGLKNNVVTAILRSRNGIVWLATEAGLSCVDQGGTVFKNIHNASDSSWIRNIVEDTQGNIWLTRQSKLYRVQNNKIVPSPLTGSSEYVVSLSASRAGKLYAAVYGAGIFSFKDNKWIKEAPVPDSIVVLKLVPDKQKTGRFYLLSPKGIYVAENGKLSPYDHPLLSKLREPFFSLEQDAGGALWLGTNSGAYYLRKKNPVHFSSDNGFTNTSVTDLYCDFEDNIWLGTDGAGVYKYEGDNYIHYDGFGGVSNMVISMEKDNQNNIWMGGYNNALVKFDGKKFKAIGLPPSFPDSQNINSLCYLPGRGMLMGTQKGLWLYNGKTCENTSRGYAPDIVSSMILGKDGTIWITAPSGLFYLDSPRPPVPVQQMAYPASAVLEVGKDSVIVATSHGLQLVRNKKADNNFVIRELENSSVLCILRHNNVIIAGTFGDGLFLIDLKTKKVKNYNTKAGLYSNDINSLAADSEGIVWAGTGRGVNRILIDTKSLNLEVLHDVYPKTLVSCNQNTIESIGNGMWIGTATGLYSYNTVQPPLKNKRPYINIESVKVFNQQVVNGKLLPAKTFRAAIPPVFKLNSFQNRVVIFFKGIYFTNPGEVYYQYRLKGLDEEFSQPFNANSVEFPYLLPGTYTFEIKAISGNRASNIQSITFEITPPFYKTIIFQISMIALLIAGVVAVQYYLNYRKTEQMRLLEAVKYEEQQKIRRQTAEDFHDDIGNKLTRIAILSEMLSKKGGDALPEQKSIIQQIKDNAATLYSGTKEILWALDPQSDNLYEVLNHVRDTGIEIFEDTGIEFILNPVDVAYKKYQLPMEYSRNISMVFKELLGNVLKHAKADKVEIDTHQQGDQIVVTVRDNGVGYAINQIAKGRGIHNIKIRAKRINGYVTFESITGKGSTTTLTINLKLI